MYEGLHFDEFFYAACKQQHLQHLTLAFDIAARCRRISGKFV
jgi:hypothetical protein